MVPPADQLERALRGFDAASFAKRHGGYKESLNPASGEYLLTCRCGSSRLRWNVFKGTWICWGHPKTDWFGRSGDTLKLIQFLEDMDELEAIGLVLDMYTGGDAILDQLPGGLSQVRKAEVRLLPPIVWPRGVERLTEPCAPHKHAWAYLETRGITQGHVSFYQLGYGREGRYKNYIVFPVFMDRSLVYIQGRAMWNPPPEVSKERMKTWLQLTGYRKTLNPPAVGLNAIGGEVLFNYDVASTYECVVVCEGPVDAIKIGPNAVALLGKTGSPVKIERLRRMAARAYVIYLDSGEEERTNALHIATQLNPYADVWVVHPPEGYDAGKLTPEQNAQVIQSAVKYAPNMLTSNLA